MTPNTPAMRWCNVRYIWECDDVIWCHKMSYFTLLANYLSRGECRAAKRRGKYPLLFTNTKVNNCNCSLKARKYNFIFIIPKNRSTMRTYVAYELLQSRDIILLTSCYTCKNSKLKTITTATIERGQVNRSLLLVKWISPRGSKSSNKGLKQAAFSLFGFILDP